MARHGCFTIELTRPSILDYFSGTPRQGQREILQRIDAAWDRYDVFVISAPVAFGKSRVAHAISSWAADLGLKATIATPDNLLLGQYTSEFPDMGASLRRDLYTSEREYRAARERAERAPVRGTTYAGYLGTRAHRDVVTFDECHRLVPFLQDKEAVRVWECQLPIPGWVQTVDALAAWATEDAAAHEAEAERLQAAIAGLDARVIQEIEREVARAGREGRKALRKRDLSDAASQAVELITRAKARAREAKRLARLANKLAQHPATYVVRRLKAPHFRHQCQCIELVPLTPRFNKPILWPPHRVDKLVLMSATVHAEDLYDLGLDQRRVLQLEAPSPIPPEQRPVVFAPVGSLGMRRRVVDLPVVVAALQRLLVRHAEERGVIHCTYELLEQLRASDLGKDPRLVWGVRGQRAPVFQEWLGTAGRDNRVLVAAGLTEGIDLIGDRASWQVVTKILYPSQADVAVWAKSRARPEWYHWQGVRDLLQTIGRICRSPTDYGITYVLTTELHRILQDWPALLPAHFWDSLKMGKV